MPESTWRLFFIAAIVVGLLAAIWDGWKEREEPVRPGPVSATSRPGPGGRPGEGRLVTHGCGAA